METREPQQWEVVGGPSKWSLMNATFQETPAKIALDDVDLQPWYLDFEIRLPGTRDKHRIRARLVSVHPQGTTGERFLLQLMVYRFGKIAVIPREHPVTDVSYDTRTRDGQCFIAPGLVP